MSGPGGRACPPPIIASLHRADIRVSEVLRGLYRLLIMAPTDSCGAVLVDDHPVFRQGVAALIGDQPDLTLIGEASTVAEARQLIEGRRNEIDVILLDLSLPDGNGLELLKDLRAREIPIPVLVLTRHEEELYGMRALQAGAQGFMGKGTDPSRILEAARTVARGDMAVPDPLRDRIVRQFAEEGLAGEQHPLARLSDRELAVFELIGRGRPVGEIAEDLHLSPKTVHTYRQRIKEKLDLASADAVLRYATMWVEGTS